MKPISTDEYLWLCIDNPPSRRGKLDVDTFFTYTDFTRNSICKYVPVAYATRITYKKGLFSNDGQTFFCATSITTF